MRSSFLRTALITAASAGALAIGVSPAAATPPSFQINPLAIPGNTFGSVQTATDINGVSDALITQTGLATQMETGWAQINGFTNNGSPLGLLQTGLYGNYTVGPNVGEFYGLYITFQGTVNGITGFSSGQTGTVAPGGYTFTLYADVGVNDTFTAGNAATSTAPSVTNTTGDIVLAQGTSLAGSVGFAPVTDAPFFGVAAQFVLCDGTPGQGKLGATTVSAPSCGTFDAASYFTSPNPFYSLDFNSSISGSANDLNVNLAGGDATLNGLVTDINFEVPEPGTVAMFGAALILLGGLGLRARRKKV